MYGKNRYNAKQFFITAFFVEYQSIMVSGSEYYLQKEPVELFNKKRVVKT